MKPEYTAEFRFYEELNDFPLPEQRKRTIYNEFQNSTCQHVSHLFQSREEWKARIKKPKRLA